MRSGVRTISRRFAGNDAEVGRLTTPRDDLVLEADGFQTPEGELVFRQEHGPFASYERRLTPSDGGFTERTDYRLEIPWFGWVFALPVRQVLARKLSHRGWWAPPDRLDPIQILVIGLLAAASMSAAFINTLFTQTVAFASEEFSISDSGVGDAGSIVRAGIVIALPAAYFADRVGRRRMIVLCAWAAPIISMLGALAPSFWILVATQTVARPLGIALAVLIGVVAAEEMPRNSRAYAVSVLAMAAGMGAGVAVASLRLADIGERGWRWVYVVAAIWCVVALDLARRLPESRRFVASAAATKQAATGQAATGQAPTGQLDDDGARSREDAARARTQRRRFVMLAAVAFIGNIYVAPASFFQNNYLRDVHNYSGGLVGLFSLIVGTPAALGLLAGGRIADNRGRRLLIAITLPVSTAAIVGAFSTGGALLWLLTFAGAIIGAASYPAMAVYRAELFPTGRRSQAGSLITASALIGGIIGLQLTGRLLDAGWSYGSTIGLLAISQVIVTLIVVFGYPETAHLELEQLNPEDKAPPPLPIN